MKTLPPLALFLAAGLMLGLSPCRENTEQRTPPPGATTRAQVQEILVKFKATVPEDSIQTLTTATGLEKVSEIRGLGVRVYRVPAGQSVEETIQKLQADPNVEYAEPNYEYRIPEKQQ